jgi:hypothetical protein
VSLRVSTGVDAFRPLLVGVALRVVVARGSLVVA